MLMRLGGVLVKKRKLCIPRQEAIQLKIDIFSMHFDFRLCMDYLQDFAATATN
jgi:hypothetical protein